MHHSPRFAPATVVLLAILLVAGGASAGLNPSYSTQLAADTVPYYDTSSYDHSVPSPNDYLSRPIGQWPAWHHEVVAYLHRLAESSDRVRLEPHGTTNEGRELFHLIISTPENLSNLDKYTAEMAQVADPSQLTPAEVKQITADLPAFCWLGYSIHGDEISGTDASVRLAWHLAAATDSATMHLLDNLIIMIDPSENPDGRERYLAMLQTYKSDVPNYDPQSLQHRGVWPWGRTNHYWFDLNRDWILLTQQETQGRVKAVIKYHPVLMVDGHEMEASGSFLFSPPRQPINYNTPSNELKWYEVYAQDQAHALDTRGWPYYTGEWNDQWYVGYASAWPTLFGTVGILYEQAGVDGQSVRQPGNYLLTYHESTNHQFTSSLANLTTTADNRVQLLNDYRAARAGIVDNGRRTGLTFLFAPDRDQIKMNRFISSLIDQGIEVQQAKQAFTVGSAVDPYHTSHSSLQLPAGTYIVSTAQPQGALAKAILEFDPHLKKEFLDDERRELEKNGDTKMYEISTWSVPLMYDLDAYYTNSRVSVATDPVTAVTESPGSLVNPDAGYGFVIDMVGEKTYLMLRHLFGEDVNVFASEKPFTVEGRSYEAGALVLRRRGNPDNLQAMLDTLARTVGIDVYGISTGYSTEGSQLGAGTFRLLAQPRVALATGMPMDYTSNGSLWFTLDKDLGIPHSLISASSLGRADLAAYNVLIIPDAWGGALDEVFGRGGKRKLDDWVSDGGTLILVGSAAAWAADSSNGLSTVALRRQVLDKLGTYEEATARALAAEAPDVDTMALWYPEKAPKEAPADEKQSGGKGGVTAEMDRYDLRFMPRGVIMRADLDRDDWMAFGLGESVPVMVYTRSAFLTKSNVQTTARFSTDQTQLRMSGLLWPEARRRWAGTAYATHESKGKGQVVLFLTDPNFRAYSYGTRMLFVNAVLYGPGFTRGGGDDYQQN